LSKRRVRSATRRKRFVIKSTRCLERETLEKVTILDVRGTNANCRRKIGLCASVASRARASPPRANTAHAILPRRHTAINYGIAVASAWSALVSHLRVNYAHVLESLVKVVLRDSQLRSHPLHDVIRIAGIMHPSRGRQPGATRMLKPGFYVTGVWHKL